MIRFVALLRGINVGGNKKVPMEKLRNMLEEMGFKNVKTLLNSGNAALDSEKTDEESLTEIIEDRFVKTFGFTSKIMIRPQSAIIGLVKDNPFQDITVTPNLRLYVTFFANQVTSTLQLPYESEKKDFKILQKTEREVFSVLTIEAARTTDTMNFIEKEFGRDSTTRNWNTVLKLINL